MAESLTVGEFTVVAIEDGVSHLPPSVHPGTDCSDLLDETGTREIPIGAYLVRGPHGIALVDAGAGAAQFPFPSEMADADGLANPPRHLLDTGKLPESLAEAGVAPGDVTTVLLTHLHLDHIGWLVAGGVPFFPHATVYYGAADWEPLVVNADPADPARAILEAAEKAGILRSYDGDDVEVLPGIRAVRTPGHTPGSYVVALESRGERLWFVGDLVSHPGHLGDEAIRFAMDTDPGKARQSRASVLATAQREDIAIAAAHVGNPAFRRITPEGTWAAAKD
ncbi:MBL fold metallo-hydrolase [Amycolatopsis sp. NPDC003861]